MQISWLVPVEPAVYAADVKNVSFPVIRKCPCCKSAARLHRNGFYPRYAIICGMEYLLRICRYLCPSCQRTISLLPPPQ
jgi:transposase-like protein